MPSSKLKKNLLVAATGVLLASAVVACGSASADSPATTEVACDQVSTQLASAQTQLTDAEAAAESAKGTPGEAEANDAVTAARTQVVDLNTRKTACDTQATTASASTSDSTTPTTSSSTPPPAPCADTWTIAPGVPKDAKGDWFPGGAPEIGAASTDEEAKAAMLAWEDKAKGYVGTLVGSAGYSLQRTVDPATLRDANGCATVAAVALDTEIRLVIANGETVVDDAPAEATNSGTAEDGVVASTGPGIDGDRKATRTKRQDGTYFWVMARCGNAVAIGVPPVAVSALAPAPVVIVVEEATPVVVTSEAPPETTVPYTPPTTVITTTPPAGKYASDSPRDTSGAGYGYTGGSSGGDTQTFSGRNGQLTSTSAASGGGSSDGSGSSESGHGDSGAGATNTAQNPVTHSSAATVDKTDSPTTNQPAP